MLWLAVTKNERHELGVPLERLVRFHWEAEGRLGFPTIQLSLVNPPDELYFTGQDAEDLMVRLKELGASQNS